MSEDTEEPKQAPKNTMGSLLGLLAVLAGIFFFYPQIKEKIGEHSAKLSIKKEVAEEGGERMKPLSQAPDELKAWVPLVKSELPQREGVQYSLVHLRMSEDGSKLLVDLKKVSGEEASRMDLILIRDEFGRYVSKLHEVPMKLYPPDKIVQDASK